MYALTGRTPSEHAVPADFAFAYGVLVWSLPHKNKIKRGYLGRKCDARLRACHRRKGKHGAETENSHHSRRLAVICCLSVSDNNRHSKDCCQLPFCAIRLKAEASFEAKSDRFYTAIPASSAIAFSTKAGISKCEMSI